MTIVEAIILGALQGITEFLPVSSSGHLVLLQRIFHISEPVLFFDTMLHVGTLAAVFAVLWKDIWNILRKIIQPRTGHLILATIPTVIIALLGKNHIERAFLSGSYLGFAFLFTALVLTLSEGFSSRTRTRSWSDWRGGRTEMYWLDALVIGIFQGIAIIPGVSRSGLTIAGALSRKLNRDLAARFSFLLAIPAILGALVFQVKELAGEPLNAAGIGTAPMVAGTLTAGVVGFLAITFMLKIIRAYSLRPFALYVALLGIFILVDQRLSHFFF